MPVNSSEGAGVATDSTTCTGIGQVGPLLAACEGWDAAAVEKHLEAGLDANTGLKGITPLFACILGQGSDKYLRVDSTPGRDVQASLQKPCSPAQIETLEVLLRHGADPWQPSGLRAKVAPVVAVAAHSTQLLKVLLQAGSSSSSGSSGGGGRISSGSTTCDHPRAKVVAALVDVTFHHGHAETVQLLVEMGLVPDLQAALTQAVAGLNIETARCAIAAGASCGAPGTNHVQTAVSVAAQSLKQQESVTMDHVASRLSRLLKLLVRNGADPHEPAVVEVAASFGLTSAMVALHGAGADLHRVHRAAGDPGLLEVTLYKKRLAFLPVLVSMGVGWRLRMPPTNLEEYNAKELFNCWLQTGVGLHYARQHGLADMAAAYQQLLDMLRPLHADPFLKDYVASSWAVDSAFPWHVDMRYAVLSRTLEVLQDPQQLGQLVEKLEASGWLQQARRTFKWPGVLTPEEAAVSWVVDAASFAASGGTVVGPGVHPVAAAAAAAAAAHQPDGSSGCQPQPQSLVTPPAAAEAAAAATGPGDAAASISTAAVGDSSSSSPSRRPALAFPPEAICALDLLTHALLVPEAAYQGDGREQWRLHQVLARQDVELLEVMLLLGVPASHQTMQHCVDHTPLAVIFNLCKMQLPGQGQGDLSKAAAMVEVLMQHGAQPNEQMMWTKEPCFKAALDLQHEGLLRALFSRSEERTPAALRRMVELVADLYKEPRGVSKWLTLLSAIGVEGLPSVGGVIHMVPGAAWPEACKVQAVEALVAAGWDINSTTGPAGVYSMLVSAAEKQQWQLVEWLHAHGARCGTLERKTALLMGAAQTGDPAGLRLLLAVGILPEPEEVQQLAVELARSSKGRHTVAAVEKRLRLQLRSLVKQQAPGTDSTVSTSSGASDTAPSAAAAAAEAAAAELLAAEEAAAAAAAAKAAKKAAKKQRQTAAKAAAAAADDEAAAASEEAAAAAAAAADVTVQAAPSETMKPASSATSSTYAMQHPRAEEAVSSSRSQQVVLAGVQGTRPSTEAVTDAATGSQQAPASPPSEGMTAVAAASAWHTPDPRVPGAARSGRSQGGASSSSTSSQQQQQRAWTGPQTAGAPAVVTAPPAAPNGARQASTAAPASNRTSTSSSSRPCAAPSVSVPLGAVAVPGAASRSPGGTAYSATAGSGTIPVALPGVAGLFWELSERRSPGGASSSSPSPPPAAPASQAAGSRTGGTTSTGMQQQGAIRGSPAQRALLPRADPAVGAGSSSMHSQMAHAGGGSGRTGGQEERNVTPPPVGSAVSPSATGRPLSAHFPGPQMLVAAAEEPAVVRRPIRVGKECVVCMAARSCVLQAPCGHLCCCETCMQLLLNKGRECPMCRSKVAEYWVL